MSCSVIGSSYAISTSSSDATATIQQRQPLADAAPPERPAAKCHRPAQTAFAATQDAGI